MGSPTKIHTNTSSVSPTFIGRESNGHAPILNQNQCLVEARPTWTSYFKSSPLPWTEHIPAKEEEQAFQAYIRISFGPRFAVWSAQSEEKRALDMIRLLKLKYHDVASFMGNYVRSHPHSQYAELAHAFLAHGAVLFSGFNLEIAKFHAAKIGPRDKKAALYGLVLGYAYIRRPEDALTVAEAYLQTNPTDPHFQRAKADLLETGGLKLGEHFKRVYMGTKFELSAFYWQP